MRHKLEEAGSEDFKREKDGSVFDLAGARAVASSKRTTSDGEVRRVSQPRRYQMVSSCLGIPPEECMLTSISAAKASGTPHQGATANQAAIQAREGKWLDRGARG
jgi:hypothetical protein